MKRWANTEAERSANRNGKYMKTPKEIVKKFAYISCFMFGLVFGLLMIPIGYISYEVLFGMPIQTLNSKNHTATLRRMFGIVDYNLAVDVDGKRDYWSGDIWGVTEREIRANLDWDTTGRVVAFEKMGKIDFAYDAVEKRELKENELKNYCLSPMPEYYKANFPNNCKENE